MAATDPVDRTGRQALPNDEIDRRLAALHQVRDAIVLGCRVLGPETVELIVLSMLAGGSDGNTGHRSKKG